MEKTDEYISFAETNYENPYENLHLLKVEDILGYMLSYKRPFTEGDKGYLLRIKKNLHKEVCKECFRFPENNDSRPEILKQFLDIENSKKEREAILEVKYVPNSDTCSGCRILKCKQAINREISKDPKKTLQRLLES